MDVNSKEADDWLMKLRITQIIHEGIPKAEWDEAVKVAADIFAFVSKPDQV